MSGFTQRNQPQPLDWRALQLEPTGSKDFGPCACCGNLSRTVWGFVHSPDASLAAYFVQWTIGSPQHGANFDLLLGTGLSGSAPKQRKAVALEYRVLQAPGAFMVIDAGTRPVANLSITGEALRRDQVVGSPLAEDVFAIVDAIFTKDDRLQDIRSWST